MLRAARASITVLALIGCSSAPRPVMAPAAGSTADAAAPGANAARVDASGTYLHPNYELADGTPVYVHVTEADMPWRIEIGLPRVPPRDASRAEARDAAIEAMRGWETAIQPQVPWFRLEFVEDDRTAPVRVEWKRRITGPWAGFGGIQARQVDGRTQVGGSMEISTQPDELLPALTLDEIRFMVAHEFGHVLGLGHCLDCDSAMNYSWQTRGRVFVTDTDVRTFRALLERPNGSRADGTPAPLLDTGAPSADWKGAMRAGKQRLDAARFAEAEPKLREALEIARIETPNGAALAISLYYLGDLYWNAPFLERASEARAFLEESVSILERLVGPDGLAMAIPLVRLADLAGESGDLERRRELRARAVRIVETQLPYGHSLRRALRSAGPEVLAVIHPDEMLALVRRQ